MQPSEIRQVKFRAGVATITIGDLKMKIREILKQRSETSKDDVKIALKLYNLVDDLEKKCRAHLKRITTVLPEFDIHDEKHSEKVIENIEMLLGSEKLKSLSTYELFLLHLSAFFHDCAMAPSDWEINTMKLTEGSDDCYQDNFSIKNDLKSPLEFSVAEKIIYEKKAHLYERFESDVEKWMFTPRKEEELIQYLSQLLIEYQDYRNGFADKLKTVQSQSEFTELNEFIRKDYIRATHHTRIEAYIKNLEKILSNAFEQSPWGKKLAQDLSLICRSHGEDINFIEKLSTNAQYYGSEGANLQFVAILLRLGDIIHFSYDRAPVDLRSSKLFKSEYSFQQWAIKNSGVNYSIDDGKITFRAYCENPETYFKLHQYIDWIEIEIQNYFRFQRQWQWSKKYIDNLQDKVYRSGITNNKDVFIPKIGLRFSLNQKRILELLMGVGLYKDKYACLRELYQNSLDAVRCMLSQNEVNNNFSKGMIEFRIDKEDDKTYLCCIDNGIGMTEEVIEDYLLKIGNSYYKSADFYRQQAKWGGKFTPISQFGIGILSCFMIGEGIEITTKTINNEYISCAIDGPLENFYYKKTSLADKENILVSGTMVKVLLSDEIATKINNKQLNKIGLLLLGITNSLPEEFRNYLSYNKNWDEHLFNKINHVVQIVPKNISLIIDIEGGTKLTIPSKPILIDFENNDLGIGTDDVELVDYLNNIRSLSPLSHKYSEIKNFIETYTLSIPFDNTEYITTLTLPKKKLISENTNTLYAIPEVGKRGICVDGILIDTGNSIWLDNYYSTELSRSGIINFGGERRPQLSVDRTSIIGYPKDCEEIAEEISKLLIKQILDITMNHIKKYQFNHDGAEFNLIWEYVFEKIGFADTFFINEFLRTEYGNILWKNLNDKLIENKSIQDFLISDEITIKNFNLSKTDILTKKLFLTKLISAKNIVVEGTNVNIKRINLSSSNLIHKRDLFSEHDLLICADKWEVFDEQFDIISNLYPLIPKRLFDKLGGYYVRKVNDKTMTVHSFNNGITAFFAQNPLLINGNLGLYHEREDLSGKAKNNIYNFENKRSKIALFEINSKFTDSNQKERYVLMVYVNPCELTIEQNKEFEKYNTTDPSYAKGVNEGWSLLATSMEVDNIIIFPGKTTREHLISLISDDFWGNYKDFTFRFTDGTIMTKS